MTDTHLLADDARRLLDELDRDVPGAAQQTGECRPAIDVFETTEAAEVLVDVAGIVPSALRVAIRKNTVLVVGAKLAPPAAPQGQRDVAGPGAHVAAEGEQAELRLSGGEAVAAGHEATHLERAVGLFHEQVIQQAFIGAGWFIRLMNIYYGTAFLEGPHYPEPHRWYAQVEVRDGVVIKVK
mgnify:CR=1 FL=1